MGKNKETLKQFNKLKNKLKKNKKFKITSKQNYLKNKYKTSIIPCKRLEIKTK